VTVGAGADGSRRGRDGQGERKWGRGLQVAAVRRVPATASKFNHIHS